MLDTITPKGWLNAVKPAYAAALALVMIQVSMGLLYKAAQSNGQYTFSATSSVAISEFLKLLLSTCFFWREWRRKSYTFISVANEEDLHGEEESALTPQDLEQDHSHIELADRSITLLPRGSSEQYRKTLRWMRGVQPNGLAKFFSAFCQEVASEVRFGLVHLALFYAIMNNMIFALFRLADPGTIQLIKSRTTLITASIMSTMLGTKIHSIQWISICMQLCGMFITQYTPEGGSTYPAPTYGLLLLHTTLSATSSVYNQALCKNNGSLHAMNMTLYCAGSVINAVSHVMIIYLYPDEPSFFTGYLNLKSMMVVISNVFIGLATTAVYKYSDALIKCFATAISTSILLYMSATIFNVDLPFLTIPGTFIVFLATYLYATPTLNMRSQSPTTGITTAEDDMQHNPHSESFLHSLSPAGSRKLLGLVASTSLTFMTLTVLTIYRIQLSQPATSDHNTGSGHIPQTNIVDHLNNATTALSLAELPMSFKSPFQHVVAFIRINPSIPKRIPILRNHYEPFFKSVHISMPYENKNPSFTNLTEDFWNESEKPYPPVAELAQILLNGEGTAVQGLLWFHFDSWIEPLSFTGMDFDKIWILDNPEAPQTWCMTDAKMMDWWTWIAWGKQNAVLKASAEVASIYPGLYRFNPNKFCTGWSDMYYLPRQYFPDFVRLARIYAKYDAYHEIAIPTIFHIIDQTYRKHPSLSILYRWADCWGNCCAENPKAFDVLRKRCGHKLNYLDEKVTSVFYEQLAKNAALLGSPIPVEATGQESPEIADGWDLERGAFKV